MDPRPPSDAGDRRPCPCGTGVSYADCCGPLHKGHATAVTPEQLMRSRFSAFAVGDVGYLLRTWHPATRPARLELDLRVRWVRLDVVRSTGSLLASEGSVEFRAHYVDRGRASALHENSRFVRQDRRWLYVGPLTEA
jgi:SEC-C motif-containing protein